MLDTVTTTTCPAEARPDHPNVTKMHAAVDRWVLAAHDRDDGARLLEARASDVEGYLRDLSASAARDAQPAAHLVGLSAFDLSEAVCTLRAEARRLTERKAFDGWTVIHAEAENAARDTAIIVEAEGEEPFTATLSAFLRDNDVLDYDAAMGSALHRGETYRGGGGAACEWSFRAVDAEARAARIAAWEAEAA